MSDQPKPFIHAPILAAWAADPEGVKIEYCGSSSESWKTRVDARHAPALHPDIRYRATLRDGTVIESPEPEPKWEARKSGGLTVWDICRGESPRAFASIHADAPDAEATAHMIAARWNGEGEAEDFSGYGTDVDPGIDVEPGVLITFNERTGRLYAVIERPDIPEGYEYMPGAVLPKPLTLEQARRLERVYRPGSHEVAWVDGDCAAAGNAYYATREQAQQVFDAMWRRER